MYSPLFDFGLRRAVVGCHISAACGGLEPCQVQPVPISIPVWECFFIAAACISAVNRWPAPPQIAGAPAEPQLRWLDFLTFTSRKFQPPATNSGQLC